MIYGLLGAAGVSGLFIYLFVQSAIANGKLRAQIVLLVKDLASSRIQLEIAANHPDTPPELAQRMRDGTL